MRNYKCSIMKFLFSSIIFGSTFFFSPVALGEELEKIAETDFLSIINSCLFIKAPPLEAKGFS